MNDTLYTLTWMDYAAMICAQPVTTAEDRAYLLNEAGDLRRRGQIRAARLILTAIAA